MVVQDFASPSPVTSYPLEAPAGSTAPQLARWLVESLSACRCSTWKDLPVACVHREVESVSLDVASAEERKSRPRCRTGCASLVEELIPKARVRVRAHKSPLRGHRADTHRLLSQDDAGSRCDPCRLTKGSTYFSSFFLQAFAWSTGSCSLSKLIQNRYLSQPLSRSSSARRSPLPRTYSTLSQPKISPSSPNSIDSI